METIAVVIIVVVALVVLGWVVVTAIKNGYEFGPEDPLERLDRHKIETPKWVTYTQTLPPKDEEKK